ncbi:hypothetical protein ARMGADRAFT_1170039 [Armillaria gallica]|uniref:Uncharacterized protein n=1 Tax=Armillaria gallica TaxID=47427 RepID=A0A2H3D0V1_ARMGA|nr:hypothetical protein ARMGADRAFT_1170039 [Armillaria gallica]
MSASCPQCGYNGQDHLPLSFEAADLSMSRMDELLKSNTPPLPAEHVQLESAIGKGHEFLAGLQERIVQARASLEDLLDEERRVGRTVELYKIIERPILRVPEDVVREIFLTSLATEEEGTDTLSRQFVPLVLSQVCRDWRSIALSTSRLWSSIKLDFDLYHDEMACQYLLQMYLLRSATHDITLFIHSMRDISSCHLIPAILLSAPRWTNLSVSIPYHSLHTFSAARGSLHRLNRLSIQFIGDVPDLPVGLAEPVFDAFEYAPLLRSFSLKGAYEGSKQISLPWSQITEYAGDEGTTSFADILKLAPRMESASLRLKKLWPHEVHNFPLIHEHTHKRLRILHVYEFEDDFHSPVSPEACITHLLSHIAFPALESLNMTYAHQWTRMPFFSPGSVPANLKSISIDAIHIPQYDIIELLDTTASISSLSVAYSLTAAEDQNEGNPHYIHKDRLLLYLNANIIPNAVPRLTSLAIRFLNEEPYLATSFVDMVQSRRNATPTHAALQTLRLSVPFVTPPHDPDVATRWKDLCDEGFVTYGVEG